MRNKRTFERYGVKDLLFVHAEGSQFHALGQVRDVAMGGICYEYIYDGVWHPNMVTVEIFSSGRSFHMSKIPCKMVYNVPGAMEPFSTLWTRVCGLQFLRFTRDQERALWTFIYSKLLSEVSQELLQAVRNGEHVVLM